MSHVPSAPIKLGEIPPAKETETWLIRAPPNNRKEITIPIHVSHQLALKAV